MVGVSIDFADVEGEGGDEVGEVVGGGFDHEVWGGHGSPEFSFDDVGFESGAALGQGFHNEEVGPDVGRVAVEFVGDEDDPGLLLEQDISNLENGMVPVAGVLFATFWADGFQAMVAEGEELEADVLAALGEFGESGGLSCFVTALGDGDIDDPHSLLAQKP